MSRYLILLILTTPFIIAAVVNALVSFKLGKISRRRFIFQCVLWSLVFVTLASLKPIYEFLFSNNLTNTEPLSLFDVVQITALVIVFYMANRARAKLDAFERRLQDLHQELSIKLASDKSKKAP